MFRKIGMQFRKPSGFFGTIISSIMIKGNRKRYDTLLKYIDIQPSDKILEIGYGPGDGLNLITNKFDASNVYGIDFSELMYKRASKRNKQFIDSKRVNLMFGDFLDTEIGTKDFNLIFCINVVYFWENLQIPFAKVKSLLKDDGVFYVFMAHKDDLSKMKFTKDDIFNKYTIEQAVDALKLAGFKNVNYNTENGYFIKAQK